MGSVGFRKIWFEWYAWTIVEVIYFYLVTVLVFLLIMNDPYVSKIPSTKTKEMYWEEGLINKYRSCVQLVLEVWKFEQWKHYCAGFLCIFCLQTLLSLLFTYYRAFLCNHPCKCIVHCWFECLRCRFRSCHNLTYLVRIRSDCKQQQQQ